MKLKHFKLVLTVLLYSSISVGAIAKESNSTCSSNKEDEYQISEINKEYLKFSSLYTGGMHFKSLGSAEGSLSIYLALNDDFDTLAQINKKKQEPITDKSIRLYQTEKYLRRFRENSSGWSREQSYEIAPLEALQSALKVSLESKSAYQHINELNLPYSFHFRQAGFDLDIFTSIGEPVDWWLKDEIPPTFNAMKEATWKASKDNDFIDWLQFVATSSAIPHLQNWSFPADHERKESYSALKKHAYEKWKATNSYAWLAALAEVAEEDDEYSGLILSEFRKISDLVTSCKANNREKAAFGMILLNAVRLTYTNNENLNEWLRPLDFGSYQYVKSRAVWRLNKLALARETLDGYRRFWENIDQSVISGMRLKSTFLSASVDDFKIEKSEKAYEFRDIELRFLSNLPANKLLEIASQESLTKKSKSMLYRTAFIRSWVNGDETVIDSLRELAELEPSIKEDVSYLLKIEDKDQQEISIFKFVLNNPSLTYLLGVELYRPQLSRKLEEFSKFNAEDGSWWCETNSEEIVSKLIDSTIRPFGLVGPDPAASGGSWGTMYYNPGQKRASLRKGEKVIVQKQLNSEIFEKLKANHKLLNYSQNENWKNFSELPPAPVYFYRKLHEIDKSSKVDDETMIELYRLVIRAAKRTCRKHDSVYQTLQKARRELNKRYGIKVS